jgi:hypothetical protein
MADRRLHAVAETRAFAEEIDALLSEEERHAVIAGIALDPDGGDLIPQSGGLRKRRIPLAGRGKRGGARLITLYLGPHLPVYAVFLFAKNERADLSPAQRRALSRLVAELKVQAHRRSKR